MSELPAPPTARAAVLYHYCRMQLPAVVLPPEACDRHLDRTFALYRRKNAVATFAKAGSYSFQVTIKDQGNLTVTSAVNVTVNATPTSITVSPSSATVFSGATQPFTATAADQFGVALAPQPDMREGRVSPAFATNQRFILSSHTRPITGLGAG